MDPVTLLTIGSAAIKTIGKAFGGKTEAVTNKVAGVVDAVRGLPQEQAVIKVEQAINDLPPNELVELKKIERDCLEIKADLEKARIASETSQHAETQQTHRTEAASTDEYVRRTRPQQARLSGYVTFAYIGVTTLLFPLINLIIANGAPPTSPETLSTPPQILPTLPTSPEVWIITAIYSPCLTYMGARALDKFKGKAAV